MAAAGGGRAEPEKASIYKAPSSLLHPGGWGLGAGSHSSMGDQWAWPHQAKRGHRAQVSPHRGPAGPGQVGCQGPRVTESQIRFFPDVPDNTAAISTLSGRSSHLPDGLGLSQGLWGLASPWGLEHQAANPQRDTGLSSKHGHTGFQGKGWGWTSPEIQQQGKGKHRSRMPWVCKTPSRADGCYTRLTEGDMEAPREVTCPRSHAARAQYQPC